ncbi:MAG: LysR family transcriptional regulator [Pseudomonadota bacterium]
MDKLRAMKYFIKVAETENFTRAAKSLGVPASSISRRIQELEAALGATLIHRTTRVVKLTELGTLYLEHVEPAVAALEYADEIISHEPHSPSGRLRITAIPDYGRFCLMPALTKLKVRYPDLVLDVELTDQVLNVENNEVDLAIRATSEPPARSVARKLSSNRFILVASPKYLESQGYPTTLADLQSHQTLLYRRPNGILYWQAMTEAGWVDLQTSAAFISNQGDALVDQALMGSGIALVYDWSVVEHLANKTLVHITLQDAELSISRSPNSAIYLLYRRPKYRLNKIRVAVDFLLSELAYIDADYSR